MEARNVLFSATQQRVLRAMFADEIPDGLAYAEILRRTGGGSGAIHRELSQFVAAGLVRDKGGPRRRVFAPNKGHPVYPELRAIAKKLLANPGETATRRRRPDPIIARTLATKYLWWTKPGDAVSDQDRLVAQVMNLGTLEDFQLIEEEFGEEYLRKVLKRAAPGHFDERSWTYWHYRLNLARPDKVPPLPRRRFA